MRNQHHRGSHLAEFNLLNVRHFDRNPAHRFTICLAATPSGDTPLFPTGSYHIELRVQNRSPLRHITSPSVFFCFMSHVSIISPNSTFCYFDPTGSLGVSAWPAQLSRRRRRGLSANIWFRDSLFRIIEYPMYGYSLLRMSFVLEAGRAGS